MLKVTTVTKKVRLNLMSFKWTIELELSKYKTVITLRYDNATNPFSRKNKKYFNSLFLDSLGIPLISY